MLPYEKIDYSQDYNTVADFSKLRKSNDLIHKWIVRFKIPKQKFIPFINDVQNNFAKYYGLLPANYKSSFKKDYPHMFYAKEVENDLVKQFYPMVVSILKRLHVESQFLDNLLVEGLLSIRNSVWKFQNHKANATFFSYAYNGCFARIWSRRSKMRKEEKAKRQKQSVYCETDSVYLNNNVARIGISSIADKKALTPDVILGNIFDYDIEAFFERANLNDEEKHLMRLYMNRTDVDGAKWSSKFRAEYKKEDGAEMTRQGVDNRLVYVQHKLWKLYCQENGMTFKDPKVRCVHRIRKVKHKK